MMTEKKPIIALTPYFNIEREEPYMRPAYLKAIRAAGGIPVILPLDLEKEDLQQIVDMSDGFLFTGGPDIHPFYFGEETQAHCGNVCLRRDRMEMILLQLVMKTGKPVFGICRGIQLLNVALGGDIYQDIPSQFPQDFPIAHVQPFDYEIPSHKVDVVSGSLLERLTGCETLNVNSMHHQACRRLAPGLAAGGYASGGLIEAIEKPDYPFFLGVQWHPEYLWEQDPAIRKIFEAFIEAAEAHKKRL